MNGSISLRNPVYVLSCATIGGAKEAQGPLGGALDIRGEKDDTFGCNTWEEAESHMQREAALLALKKAGITKDQVNFCIAGDLLGQSIASSYGSGGLQIPMFGIYGACSTCGEALALGAICIDGGYAEYVLCVTSSHFAGAEKEFRFPCGYGNQRPLSATWTVTGAGAFVLGRKKTRAAVGAITGLTVGSIIDYGSKDSLHMGAAMAPAAAHTIARHFKEFHRSAADYDQIVTGDLGTIGVQLLRELLKKDGIDIAQKHTDCGVEIYDLKNQEVGAGGSGCGCAAVVLGSHILEQLRSGRWEKLLFVPTGALLSKTSFQEGRTIPAIAPGIVLERVKP